MPASGGAMAARYGAAVRRGPLALAITAVLVSGCHRGGTEAPGAPTVARVSPLGELQRPAGVGQTIAGPAPGTAPAGGLPGPAPGQVRDAATPAPAAPIGVIPVATTRPTVPVDESGPPALDPDVAALSTQVDPARLTASVRSLVGFGTRHSLSPADKPARGVDAAARWLAEQFAALDGTNGNQVLVELEEFPLTVGGRQTTQRNVLATLPGIDRSKRIVYVTAHYDSVGTDDSAGQQDAPGADDDGSGTAALLELARLMATRKWDATIRFAAFAAEEQDAAGSRYHASAAQAIGLPIIAALNLDIVGSNRGPSAAPQDGQLDVYSADPPDSASRQLARYVQGQGAEAALTASVAPQPDRTGRRGDQLSFSDVGFPAVRLVEAHEDAERQHSARDTLDRLDPAYLAAVTRLTLGVAASLALAPSAPLYAPVVEPAVEAPGRVHARWDPVDDPAVAGYWVGVRASGETAYTSLRWVGRNTAILLDERAPGTEVAVAVAAADDLGHTSPFSAEATWRF